MDIDRFEKLARDPRRTRTDLESMKENAANRGEHDFVRIVDEILRDRFPMDAKKSGGKTPTATNFRALAEHFDTGKDAYLWLVGQFCRFHNGLLADYERLHIRAGKLSKGRRFARDHKALFPKESTRQGNASFYASVGDGWYADVNLNHDDKFATLLQLSYLCSLEYERDWNFKVLGATQKLIDHQVTVRRAQKALDDLLAK